jgi:FKBP-type peptidyl-prolyl cis-trans isomerase FklB
MKILKNLFIGGVALSLFYSCNSSKNSMETEGFNLNNEIDSVSYSLGVNIANNIKSQGFDDINPAAMAKAIEDVYTEGSEPMITAEEAGNFLNNYFQTLQAKKQEAATKEGAEFLAQNAARPEVTTTESGLQYEVLTQGDGPKPAATDEVTVHYHGTLPNGEVFDSSVDRGQPATFGLNQVIKGWTEGVQLMNVGSKYRFVIPSDLAYGPRGAGGKIGPNATLVFEVELLSIAGK